MNHTPGPWTFEDNATSYDYIRLWGWGGKVHMGWLNKQPGQEERVLADARLFSAAPSMEKALLLWRRADAMLCNEPGLETDIALSQAREATDAALARAQGKELEHEPS